MKYRDPSQVCCPECALRSEHSVKKLLARRAQCPRCGYVLAEIGEKMQISLNEAYGFTLCMVLSIAIEEEKRGLGLDDRHLESVHGFRALCLHDFVGVCETLLIDLPECERRAVAIRLVEVGFRKQFPTSNLPPLDARLIELGLNPFGTWKLATQKD